MCGKKGHISRISSNSKKRQIVERKGTTSERKCKKEMYTTLMQKRLKAEITLKAEHKPKFCQPRVVPYALRSKVEAELSRLTEIGVLSPVQYSEWSTPIVHVIKKDGSVQICPAHRTLSLTTHWGSVCPFSRRTVLQQSRLITCLPPDERRWRIREISHNFYTKRFIPIQPLAFRDSRELWTRFCKVYQMSIATGRTF